MRDIPLINYAKLNPPGISFRHARHSKRILLDWNLPRCFDALKGPKAIIPRQDFRASQSIGQSASDFDSLDPPAWAELTL